MGNKGRKWVLGRLLGSGAYGKVHLAVERCTGDFFAVKSAGGQDSRSPRRNAQDVAALENEISILTKTDCPQVRYCNLAVM